MSTPQGDVVHPFVLSGQAIRGGSLTRKPFSNQELGKFHRSSVNPCVTGWLCEAANVESLEQQMQGCLQHTLDIKLRKSVLATS